jgi:hypothetical protein
VHPRADIRRHPVAALPPALAGLLRFPLGRDEQHQQAGAECLDEVASIERESVLRSLEQLVALAFDVRLAHWRRP